MDSYQIIRIFVKNEQETHSVEFKDDYIEAQQRYYNIIAADLGNPDVTYQAAYLINSQGLMLEGKVFDRRVAPTAVEE